MLLTLLSATLLIIGIVGLILYERSDINSFLAIGLIGIAIGGFVLLISLMLIIGAHANPEYQYQQDYMIYETLKYEEEHSYITFAEDVINYNHQVRQYKTWSDNPWVNWFYYDGCENLPYYELK